MWHVEIASSPTELEDLLNEWDKLGWTIVHILSDAPDEGWCFTVVARS